MNTLQSSSRQRLLRPTERVLALITVAVVGRTLFYAGVDAFTDYVFGDLGPPPRNRPVTDVAGLEPCSRHLGVRDHLPNEADTGPLAPPRVA